MARKKLSVLDGPLEGQVYELDLDLHEETRLRLGDGRGAIYRAERDLQDTDSLGHAVWCLRFVRIDDPA